MIEPLTFNAVLAISMRGSIDINNATNATGKPIAGSTTIGGELSVGGIEVAAMINDLLNAVDSLQSTIGAMQEQIDLLNNGE